MRNASNNELHDVAAAFVAARRNAQVLSNYPGTRPDNLSDAYVIQDHAITLDGRAVVGWKVGRINPPDDARLGSNRLVGPIFGDAVRVTTGVDVEPNMRIYAGGFAAAEAELVLHLADGWNRSAPRNDDETLALIDDVRLGIEIASSPYPRINSDGPAVTASDFGNNAGLVLGESLNGWRHLDLCSILVRVEIDDRTVGQATAATMLDGPLGAIRFLIAHLVARGIDQPTGFWVSTGAITGVHEVMPQQRVRAIFGSHGTVRCRINPAHEQ
jgi:2-keto-4-pentenoate hydratase